MFPIFFLALFNFGFSYYVIAHAVFKLICTNKIEIGYLERIFSFFIK